MTEKMTTGWLWFDNDPGRTLEEKIARAAARYQAKFGAAPNTCYVNPQAMTTDEQQCNGLRVIAARHILPHHFWLGVEGNGRG